MAIQGLRATDNWQADQRPKDWNEAILLLFPNGMAPLTALRSMMKKKSTIDPEFSWFEKRFDDQRLALNGNLDATGGTDTITVVTGASGLKKDHLLYVEQTGELLLVNTDPTSETSISVTRGAAGTTVTAVTFNGAGVNPNLVVAGTAHMEGSLAPTAISRNPSKLRNYTQIFRNSLSMTRTAQQTRLRTGKQIAESKREALEYHTVEMERAALFGVAFEDLTGGSEPRRYSQGIFNFIDVNSPAENKINFQAHTAKDLQDLLNDLEILFRWGSQEKVGFCGNAALLNLNRLILAHPGTSIIVGPETKEYGMTVHKVMTPFGTLVLKSHPLFNRITSGVTAGTAYRAMDAAILVMDMENIRYRYLDGSDTQFKSNQETPGQDAMVSGYLTECGYEWHHAETFGYIKGFSA